MPAKVKVYRPHWGLLSDVACTALDLRSHVKQGTVYIAAPTKAAALRHADPAQLSTSASEYRVDGYGNACRALLAAGLLAADGEIIATPSNQCVRSPIARRDPETGQWTVIGHFTGTGGFVAGVALLPGGKAPAVRPEPATPKKSYVLVELHGDTTDDELAVLGERPEVALVIAAGNAGEHLAYGTVVSVEQR